MVGQITTLMAAEHINILDLINHHHKDYAYNIIDTEQKIEAATLEHIMQIEGVIRVRQVD